MTFIPIPMSLRLFPALSSVRFSESGITLRSLIHLALSIVPGDKYASTFIFLHTYSKLDQRGAGMLHPGGTDSAVRDAAVDAHHVRHRVTA